MNVHPGPVFDDHGLFQECRVQPLTGHCHSGGEEEPGAFHFPFPLPTLDLERQVVGVAPGRENRPEPVVGITLEVLDNIFAGVVLGSPAHVALVSYVHVNVDQGGNNRLPSQVDRGGSRRRGDLSGAPDLEDPVTLYQEGSVLDHAAIPDDQTRSVEKDGHITPGGR